MKLYSENKNYKLYEGSMLDMLDEIQTNSIDSIITDPPYELNFMNKGWDNSGIAFQPDTWKKCYEVLKPGGYLLAFGGSRTFHRIACAIEDAGFEIRDTIMWLYGSGFPKSLNIGLALDKKNSVDNRTGNIVKGVGSNNTNSMKNGLGESQEFAPEYEERKATNEWAGWGTALKPSFEPIIVARKPFKGSLVDNVIENGVGGLNIDECRVETQDDLYRKPCENGSIYSQQEKQYTTGTMNDSYKLGRFPANTILTYDETDFDEVCGGFPYTNSGKIKLNSEVKRKGISADGSSFNSDTCGFDVNKGQGLCSFGDSGSASRYFYCAKASKKDRDEGLDDFEASTDKAKGNGLDRICEYCGVSQLTPELCKCKTKSWITKPKKNIHPTVKPTELMQYLVRLVTPNGGTVLDPFNGSGSTGKAVMYENKERNKNYKYIGIELTEEYLPIAKARIEYAYNYKYDDSQLSIFDLEDILRGK